MLLFKVIVALLSWASIMLIIAAFMPSAPSVEEGSEWYTQGANLQRRLQNLIYQARAEITVTEFVSVSLFIGVALAAIFFFVVRSPIVSFFAFFSGGFFYYLYLDGKRETKQIEYEMVGAGVISMFLSALESYNNDLPRAIQLLSERGDAIVRDDWRRILAAFSGNQIDTGTIRDVVNHRASTSFALLMELIVQFSNDIEQLKMILQGDKEAGIAGTAVTVAKDIRIQKLNMGNLKVPKQYLAMFSLMVPGFLIFGSFALTGVVEFYQTPVGSVVLVFMLGATLAIYIVFTRLVSKTIRTRNFVFHIQDSRASTTVSMSDGDDFQMPSVGDLDISFDDVDGVEFGSEGS